MTPWRLRGASLDDADVVYPWSIDPMTRAMSVRSETFTLDAHRLWWRRKLEDPDSAVYVLATGVGPIALVRYEAVVVGRPLWTGGPVAEETTGEAEVAIVVAPGHRGRGLGTTALQMTTAPAMQRLGASVLVALILPTNAASIRMFEKAGYSRDGDTHRLGKELLRYVRRS